jgi:hypothetical protein
MATFHQVEKLFQELTQAWNRSPSDQQPYIAKAKKMNSGNVSITMDLVYPFGWGLFT